MGVGGSRDSRSAPPAAGRDAPRLATSDQLVERGRGLWWGAQLLSLALHAVVAVSLIRVGTIVLDYSMRWGGGNPFSSAVRLVSPLFELGPGDSGASRQRIIPLSALVPEQKLYEPDLNALRAAWQKSVQKTGAAAPEARQTAPWLRESIGAAGFGGGAESALLGGGAPEALNPGPVVSFDLVPPSNTRYRRPDEKRQVQIRVGDAGIPGGGTNEGLRLPAAPARLGIAAEITLNGGNVPAVEGWLRTLIIRLRRASFELMPDRRDLGPSGLVRLSFELDPAGRMIRPRVTASSGNAVLDRLALVLLQSVPASAPLPDHALPESANVSVLIRYFPAR